MTQPALRSIALAALLITGAASAQANELQLTIKDGLVTLVADNVPVKKILEEWARVGESRIVNLDRLTGPPVTLRLTAVPERQALDVLLRSAAGYLAAPRADGAFGASQFDRILIMATSKAPPASAAPPTAAQPQPFVPQPAQPPAADDQYEPEEGETELTPPPPGGVPAGVRGGAQAPVFLQPNPVPFQGTGAAEQQQQPPPQGAPAVASPRPGLPPTSDQQLPPVTNPAAGLSPVPGFNPNPVTPTSPTGTAQKPPPKKPGGGSF